MEFLQKLKPAEEELKQALFLDIRSKTQSEKTKTQAQKTQNSRIFR